MNPLRFIKNAMLPAGRRPRVIVAGAFRGIRMDLDLRTESQICLGLFERELYPWLPRLAQGIRSVVDIGAAHGEYTLYALKKTGAERVIGFEPNEWMLAKLRRNLQLNGMEADPRLEIHEKYLSDTDGLDSLSASVLADRILAPCLIKMDIDGGETAVLRAAAGSFLSMSGLRWLIETHSKALEAECISILRSAGYSTTIVPNAWWRTIIPEQRVDEQNRWLVATR